LAVVSPNAPTAPALSGTVRSTGKGTGTGNGNGNCTGTGTGTLAAAPLPLVVIDATWRKSSQMLLDHPALSALPRLSLDAPAPTRYRAIRAAQRADQVSTLKMSVQALSMVERASFDAAPLLGAFSQFVAGMAARQRRKCPRA